MCENKNVKLVENLRNNKKTWRKVNENICGNLATNFANQIRKRFEHVVPIFKFLAPGFGFLEFAR